MNQFFEGPEVREEVSPKALIFALRCLGLPGKCTDKERMKEAWKKAMWELHPDRLSAISTEFHEDKQRRTNLDHGPNHQQEL